MNFRLLRSLCCAALFACGLLAHAETALPALQAQLPLSPQVQRGKLANGLTYYIQRNARPEKKLELRLVVKAGSILEDEDQRGLAHFTEHMAFNGSTHFKHNELVSYLQSIGVKFGADLNAYTSFDETVYILPIPTEQPEAVEQGFLVLEDWAHGLNLDGAEIDKERAIVLEELRLGKGAQDRMNKVLMPKMLNGSRYAERLPIGQEQVLRNFSHEALRRFYRDWYRPDLMAVVVVGDIEPARARALIERHFGKLKNPARPRPRVYARIPARSASEGLVVTDKEASGNMVYIRYPVQARPVSNTLGEYRQNLIESLYGSMLGQRMSELTQQAEPPFVQGGSGMAKVVRGYRSYSAGAVLGKGGALPAIAALVQEDQRARRFGFSEAELERARKAMLRNSETMYAERDKSDSAGFVAEYVRNFLEDEPIPGIENEYRYTRQLVPALTLAEVNAAVRAAIPEHDKKLVVYLGSDRAETPAPAAEQLLAAVNAAERQPLQARVDKAVASTLMASLPAPGRIVAERRDAALGLTELTLDNGVKVVLKPTDFQNDQVLLGGLRWGGQSLAGSADIVNARYASAVAGHMGLLDFTPSDLQKILAGKSVSVSATVGNLYESVSGGAASADVETMLQLVYLKMTAPRQDAALYSAFVSAQRDAARTALARPEALFGDTVTATLFDQHPRVARVARPEDFDRLSLERAFDIYRSRMGSARDFTFYLVGSFDAEQIKPLLARYLGSLPVGELPVAYQDLGVRPVSGVLRKEVRKGTEAKSTVSITFSGMAPYSEAQRLRLRALTEVLNIRITEVLREKLGLIYGGGMSGGLQKIPYEGYGLTLTLPCAPENVDKVIAAVFAEIDRLKAEGAVPADLDKVKANWSTGYRKALRDNGYWLGQLQQAQLNGSDPAELLSYEQRSAAITPAELGQAAQRYFDMANYVQVVLNPEQ